MTITDFHCHLNHQDTADRLLNATFTLARRAARTLSSIHASEEDPDANGWNPWVPTSDEPQLQRVTI